MKKLFILFLALMASLGTTFAAITVRLDPQSCSSWSKVYLWAWTSEGNVFDVTWPGEKLTIDTNGWYNYTFDSSIKTINIIWTNGTDQTIDITNITESTCYALNSTSGTSITVKAISCSLLRQINNVYYYLDGETHTAEVAAMPSGKYSGNIIIPGTVVYNSITYDVTSIGEEAFKDCSGLTSITISNSITSIGNHAFADCSSLRSIEIPNSVTYIGRYAFKGCTSLTSVTISNSVTDTGQGAFSGCSGLTSITIPNSVTSIGEDAFSGCAGLTSVIIGNSVTRIGLYAFDGCSNITSVVWNAKKCNSWNFGSQVESFVFGDSVEVIPESLCSGMNKLTSITIPNSVTGIGNYAFSGCSGLTSVTMGNSVKGIDYSAFSGCSGLTSITIPNSVTEIRGRAFSGCSNITSVIWNAKNCNRYNFGSQVESFVFGDSVEVIPESLCSSMNKLTSITIPNRVTSIGVSAFRNCTGLTSITIPNSVTSIGNNAFSDCSKLTNVTIGNSVTSIGSSVFSGCSGLTSVTMGNSVTSIGDNAFSDCGLTSITIPNSVTSIGEDAFSGCAGLTSVILNSEAIVSKNYTSAPRINNIFGSQVSKYIIGNSVTSIGEQAFYGCSKLTDVTIGNNVTSIGERAFYICTSITTVIWNARNCTIQEIAMGSPFTSSRDKITTFVFGDKVKVIPKYLCRSMTQLTTITIPNSVTSIEDYAFDDCTNLKSVTLGNSVTSIGSFAFYGCIGLTSVTMGNSVTSIGASAFSRCSGLTSIEIPNSVTSIGDYAFSGCSGLTSPVYNVHVFAFLPVSHTGAYVIPNGIESIAGRAFYKCKGLTSVSIPNSVTSIGNYAFSGCEGLTSVTCFATTPPKLGNSVFYVDNSSSRCLYVPAGSIDAYKATDQWKEFSSILPISAEKTETTDVITSTTDNSVDIAWPQVNNAYTYILVIKDKNGNIVCTLTFNSQGQLTSIAFNAPARGDAPQHTQTAGFAFEVTGLESGTTYNLTITAKNENGQEIDRKNVTFRTSWPQGIDDVIDPSKATKVIRDGQIFILRGDKTFDLRGQEVK